MQAVLLRPEHAPELAGTEEPISPGEGYYWIDVERSETDWEQRARHWLGSDLHERHFTDSLNGEHPPFYDGTDDYDMLIVRSLAADCSTDRPVTRPVALFVFPHAVVSVRPSGDDIFHKLRQRLLGGQRRPPDSPAALLHLLLHQIVDRLLERRTAITELLSGWQDRLLDPQDGFADWGALMHLRSRMRGLELVTETQLDALAEWRQQTSLSIERTLEVRFNDLAEHLNRVLRHASMVQTDIDSLVQIYFSAASQRTNGILQFLTAVSMIFLPLNLIAGIFGMNFEFMPFLHHPWAAWLTLTLMLVVALGLLLWSRRKRWF